MESLNDTIEIGNGERTEVYQSAELDSWNEANRRAREEYYAHPGPFYWIPVEEDDVRLEPVDQGIPAQTVRQALETALDDLHQARLTISRQDRVILGMVRDLIQAEIRTKTGNHINGNPL